MITKIWDDFSYQSYTQVETVEVESLKPRTVNVSFVLDFWQHPMVKNTQANDQQYHDWNHYPANPAHVAFKLEFEIVELSFSG